MIVSKDHNVIEGVDAFDALCDTCRCMHGCGRAIGKDWMMTSDHVGDMVVGHYCYDEMEADQGEDE